MRRRRRALPRPRRRPRIAQPRLQRPQLRARTHSVLEPFHRVAIGGAARCHRHHRIRRAAAFIDHDHFAAARRATARATAHARAL